MVWKARKSKIDEMPDNGETLEEVNARIDQEMAEVEFVQEVSDEGEPQPDLSPTITTANFSVPFYGSIDERAVFLRETAKELLITILSSRPDKRANADLVSEAFNAAVLLADKLEVK